MKCVFWQRLTVSMLAGVALLQAMPATALVIGSSVDNLDGTYTYSYRVDNSAGGFDIAAWSLEFPFLTPDWDPLDTFSGGDVVVPSPGWFADAGVPITGLSAQDFLSLDPSADVLIGTSLAEFSFVSGFAPGLIPFHEFSAVGDSASGNTVGPAVRATPVPDAGVGFSLVGLLWLGLLYWVSQRRRIAIPVWSCAAHKRGR